MPTMREFNDAVEVLKRLVAKYTLAGTSRRTGLSREVVERAIDPKRSVREGTVLLIIARVQAYQAAHEDEAAE